MTTFLLIRHGENDFLKKNKMPGRLPGIHLNERGCEQAEELARALNQLPIKAVYSSPLERAIETANPLARSLGLEIQICPELTDIDVGDWEGRSWKMLGRTRIWKAIQITPSKFQFPGGESFAQAQERIVQTLDVIIEAHPTDELIAIFFHSDPIKLAVAHYLGLSLDSFQRLAAFTGSVTLLKLDGASIKLLGLNLIPPFAFPNL
jgi:broad specificity phosphatase PhoE